MEFERTKEWKKNSRPRDRSVFVRRAHNATRINGEFVRCRCPLSRGPTNWRSPILSLSPIGWRRCSSPRQFPRQNYVTVYTSHLAPQMLAPVSLSLNPTYHKFQFRFQLMTPTTLHNFRTNIIIIFKYTAVSLLHCTILSRRDYIDKIIYWINQRERAIKQNKNITQEFRSWYNIPSSFFFVSSSVLTIFEQVLLPLITRTFFCLFQCMEKKCCKLFVVSINLI